MKYIALWLIAGLLLFINGGLGLDGLTKIVVPLLLVFVFVAAYRMEVVSRVPGLAYLLFFAVSLTSLLGFTETLTGSHAESSNPFLFGLSFYTASLAFFVASNKKIGALDAFKIGNPLLLSTGPVALFVRSARHRSVVRRVNYFLPFVIVGFFLFQIVATPLTEFFFLIDETDAFSVIIFAIIFEIFVYANFCGLSLAIYGLFGLLGYSVPLNFRQPFSSSNILDFWKGWHASLSSVLKVLFYSPLRSKFPQFIALLGVYIGSALWHGITVNFLIWGTFHALVFWLSLQILKRNIPVLPVIMMIFGVVVGRLIFADSQTGRLLEKLSFSYEGVSVFESLSPVPTASKVALFLGVFLISVEFFFQKHGSVKKRNYKHLRSPVALSVLVLIGVLMLAEVGVDYAVYGQR